MILWIVFATWMLGILLPIPFVYLGARIVGREWVERKQVVAACLAMIGVNLLSNLLPIALPDLLAPWLSLGIFACGILALLGIFKRIFKTTWRKSLVIWLWGAFSGMVYLALSQWAVQRYLFELHKIPTLSMAPTLVGSHVETLCPRCGGIAVARDILEDPSRFRPERLAPDELMICGRCGKTSLVGQSVFLPVQAGDRVITDKLSQPKRWDVIVYHFPEDPFVLYAKRLVGLPGELVAIRDGKIWINGRPIETPPAVSRLTYVSNPARGYWRQFDPPDAKLPEDADNTQELDPGAEWQLGKDTYFVLGDFSERSSDSRVPNRSSAESDESRRYGISGRHIEGVVRSIYWPPRRWKKVE